MLSLLNVARPIAMKALQNPKILGSLLVGTFGSQQANEIQNQLKLGNISLDNIYDTLINFAASPAVSALRDTPSGQESSPDEAQIEAERKFNEELNRRVTLPSQTPIEQLLSTPPTTTIPEPLITPDVPEEKTKVEDVGMTASPDAKLSDLIMTMKGDTSDANEETTGTRQEEGQTTIEALKAQSEESKARDVDRGPQSDQGEYVLKTEEGFEIAPLEQSSDFFTRTMLGEIGTPKSRYEPILNLSELGQTFDIFEEKRSGNFENHIFTSIPTFKEAQVATADALIKSLPQNANVLDIGGTEGGFINTIAEVRPDVTGFIVDPNVVAEKIFNQQKMPNSYYIREAFTTDKSKFGNYAFDVKDEKKQPISTDFFDANLIEDNSLDAITEKMTFQFIDKGRNNKVKLISEKLKPTGIALFEEKFFTSYDDPVWKANEDKKNQFKLQYYDQKDLTKKQKETLEGMDRRQVTSEDFEKILMKHFNNVAQYWDSGNFKGYIASDSADALNNFLSNLPDLNSEYSNVQTPSFVTKPVTKKRRGGPISIPKIDML